MSSLANLPSSLLLAEDNEAICAKWALEIARVGCHVASVHSVRDLRTAIRSGNYEFALLDLFILGGRSLDVVAELQRERRQVPCVFVSSYWEVDLAREAGAVGALEVIEKPIWPGHLEEIIGRNWSKHFSTATSCLARTSEACLVIDGPKTNMSRFVGAIEKIVACDTDPKTVALAAAAAGMSESSFEDLCDVLGIRPQAARDVARMLRVIIQSAVDRCPIDALLNASDKTIGRLFNSSRIPRGAAPGSISIESFLMRQQFIDNDAHPRLMSLLYQRLRC